MNISTRFKRTALIVSDLDRALAIYCEAVGFALQSIKQSAGDSYSYEIFGIPAGSSIRMAALDGPGDQSRTLALLEVAPALPPWDRPRQATVVFVENVAATSERLAAIAGVRLFAPRQLNTHDGKVGLEAAAIDPDGHAIVFYHV